jgi:SnoaL-like polyketide cyclase
MQAVDGDLIVGADSRARDDAEPGATRCLAAEEGVALEVRISGTQLGSWRGLPPTGRPVVFPLCGLFSFDEGGMLAGERIYYDRGSVLRQVGLYHDPQSFVGRLEILLAHPITVTKAYGRRLFRFSAGAGGGPGR